MTTNANAKLACTLVLSAVALSTACAPKPAKAPTPPTTEAATPGRDPKIMELAKGAASCKFEEGSFDNECVGYKAWSDNEELFAEGKGDATLFSLLGDSDEKLRALAESKGLDKPKDFFGDKQHATDLFALAKKQEKASRTIGRYVASVDAEKHGLTAELKALATHPSIDFRKSLASIIAEYQSPAAVEVITALVADADTGVQESAISALSTGGITPAADPVCALLSKQFARTDKLVGGALWAGSSSKCNGMGDAVIAELTKRAADPSKVTNAVGVNFALAASGVCTRTQSADLKKKGFAIGKKLADAKVTDVNTRHAALDVLTSCDPAAAVAALKTLSNDKDKTIAADAKKALDTLAAKKK